MEIHRHTLNIKCVFSIIDKQDNAHYYYIGYNATRQTPWMQMINVLVLSIISNKYRKVWSRSRIFINRQNSLYNHGQFYNCQS